MIIDINNQMGSSQSLLFTYEDHSLTKQDDHYYWVWESNHEGKASVEVQVMTGYVDLDNYHNLRNTIGAGPLIIKHGSEYTVSMTEYVPSCADMSTIYYQITSTHPYVNMKKNFYVREIEGV